MVSRKPVEYSVVASEAARGAGAILRAGFGSVQVVGQKTGVLDLVTETDTASEAWISRFVGEHFPNHGFLGEEGGQRDGKAGEPVWIVDPLDGTTNFAHGIPIFAVSIAVVQRGEVLAGVVYDPMRDELFAAARGNGAALNGLPLRVSDTKDFESCVVSTGFAYDRRERPDYYLSYCRSVMIRAQGIRRCGAAAIDLAWLAAGRYDAFWEFGLKAWDVAAGSLLISEAGGRVSDLAGDALDLFGGRIAASNGATHEQLLACLELAEPPEAQAPPVPDRPPGW